jgi:glyoxylase-like metal-dependent hydrolase (beta-lactamase superfamily II)
VTHGSIRIGGVEVVALCDAVVRASRSIAESFPLVPEDRWATILAEHPDSVAEDGRWRLHIHAFVVRAEGRTILFDAGVGPASAPAFGWTRTEGALDRELAAAGVGLAHVDTVVVSHVHDDHLGWLATPDGHPRFPNARFIVNAADLASIRSGDDEDRAIHRATLAPLEAAGVLDPSDERLRLGAELEVVRAAGHTPGHQVLVIDDGDARAILSADATNHHALIEDATWSGATDADPDLAAASRAELLELAERDARIWIASHLADPFLRIVTEDGRRRGVPVQPS